MTHQTSLQNLYDTISQDIDKIYKNTVDIDHDLYDEVCNDSIRKSDYESYTTEDLSRLDHSDSRQEYYESKSFSVRSLSDIRLDSEKPENTVERSQSADYEKNRHGNIRFTNKVYVGAKYIEDLLSDSDDEDDKYKDSGIFSGDSEDHIKNQEQYTKYKDSDQGQYTKYYNSMTEYKNDNKRQVSPYSDDADLMEQRRKITKSRIKSLHCDIDEIELEAEKEDRDGIINDEYNELDDLIKFVLSPLNLGSPIVKTYNDLEKTLYKSSDDLMYKDNDEDNDNNNLIHKEIRPQLIIDVINKR